MVIVRVNTKVVQDDSGVFTEILVLLDKNKQPVKPLVDFVLEHKHYGKSKSTINNYTQKT